MDDDYSSGYEQGIRDAHDSLEPLFEAFMACVNELEQKMAPGEYSDALVKIQEELLNRIQGGSDEGETIN